MQGNPVFPMIMRKDPSRSGTIAVWNDSMESGVSVKPRSLNMDAGVKMPLERELDTCFKAWKIEHRTTRPLTGDHHLQQVPKCCYVLSKGEGQSRREDGKGHNMLSRKLSAS